MVGKHEAPTAWTMRAASSIGNVSAARPTSDPRPNTAVPNANSFRTSYWSASFPYMSDPIE